jgi:hypothetical protein
MNFSGRAGCRIVFEGKTNCCSPAIDRRIPIVTAVKQNRLTFTRPGLNPVLCLPIKTSSRFAKGITFSRQKADTAIERLIRRVLGE